MIKVNEKMPIGHLQQLVDGNLVTHNSAELFANRKTVLFAVPGAFTPTCSAAHLPGYVVKADELFGKGVDQIVCLSVNDAFVMSAWGDAQNAENIMMLADGDGSYSQALGLAMETGEFGGLRSKRYAMIIENNEVTSLFIENPKEFEVSKAEVVLKDL